MSPACCGIGAALHQLLQHRINVYVHLAQEWLGNRDVVGQQEADCVSAQAQRMLAGRDPAADDAACPDMPQLCSCIVGLLAP